MLKKYKETVCKCNICIKMCKTRPCWGTPEEVKKIIEAGFANKLMLDYWVSSPNIYIVSPAITGYEKTDAPYRPIGQCAFLNKKNLCELHNLNLKPSEGRMSGCENNNDEYRSLHHDVAMTWDNDEGKEVILLWKKEVNYERMSDDEDDEDDEDFSLKLDFFI